MKVGRTWGGRGGGDEEGEEEAAGLPGAEDVEKRGWVGWVGERRGESCFARMYACIALTHGEP